MKSIDSWHIVWSVLVVVSDVWVGGWVWRVIVYACVCVCVKGGVVLEKGVLPQIVHTMRHPCF